MFLYERPLVDEPIRASLLQLMAENSAYTVVTYHLQEIYWQLLVDCYPLSESYTWLTRGQSIPHDLELRKNSYFDARTILYGFWDSLCEPSLYGTPQARLPDGTFNASLYMQQLHLITTLPFRTAIQTWYGTCVAWLQVCNIEWYSTEAKRHPNVRLWKPGEERYIPQYIAGYMALQYF